MGVTVKKKPIAAKTVTPSSFTGAIVTPEPANDEVSLAKTLMGLQPTDVLEAVDPLAAEIDALGAMEPQLKAAKEVLDDYAKRFSIVRDKLVAAGELTKAGSQYFAQVKETGNKVRTIKDMPLAIKHLSVETFLKVAKIGLADIDKYLTEAQKDEVIATSESKTRSMKILKKP